MPPDVRRVVTGRAIRGFADGFVSVLLAQYLTGLGFSPVEVGAICPSCKEPWLRKTNLPGRYRCVFCLHRFELRSDCPDCGSHATIARMTDDANVTCRNCGGSMLLAI